MHIVALEQMLPSGEVYFRQVITSKLPREPRMELILFSDLQFGPAPSGQVESAIFGISSSCFTKSAGFISLTGEALLVSSSEAVLLLRA